MMRRTPFRRAASTTTHESEQEREQRLIDKARRAMNSVVPRAANMGSATTAAAPIPKAARMAAKVERASIKARKEAIKTLADLKREAQTALNRWIVQVRDSDKPCISCGRHHQGQWHAGHYMSRGAAPQHALNPLNVHKQCAPCNTYLHGNLIAYRVRLTELIGLEAVEAMENDNAPRKWTREELIQIRDTYRAKLKALKSNSKQGQA